MSTKILHAAVSLAFILSDRADEPEAPVPGGDFMSMSLEQLVSINVDKVYAASKREESVSSAPSSVSIVTAQDIKEYGYRTLLDLLDNVRGVYTTSDRNYEFLGVRGVSRPGDFGGRNLLLVDGHRMNEPIFDSLFLANSFILDPDLIDRVEVVRGPGSALYGNNAFFSVINVVTKSGHQFNWAEASVDSGTFDTYKGRFTVGKGFTNQFEFLLSGSYLESGGIPKYYEPFFDDGRPEHNRGVADHLDYERARSLFAKLSYRDFTFESGYNSREKGVPTASYGTVFNDSRYQTVDSQKFSDFKYEHAFDHDWSILARVSYSEYDFDALYPYDYAGTGNPSDYVINRDAAAVQTAGIEAQVSKILFDQHILTGGVEYRNIFNEDYKNSDIDPFQVYQNIHLNDSTVGGFFNGEFQIWGTNVVLHAGLRYDTFEHYDSSWSPRSALVLQPLELTTFKIIYGKAYRTPNLYERLVTGPISKGNSDLAAETIRTYELVWEQRLNQTFSIVTDGYLNEIQGLIDQVTDPIDGTLVSKNAANATAKGIEFELVGRHSSGVRGQVSYAYSTTDPDLSNSPHHLAKIGLSVPLIPEKLNLGLTARYRSDVATVTGRSLKDYWSLDATLLSQKIFRGLEISASVYNLLDQKFDQPAGPEVAQEVTHQDGRSFRFKLTYHF